MEEQKIERVDEIPLILNWLMKMRTAEMIDAVWHSHGNWQGLSYGQLAVLFITYVVYTLNHRLSGMEDWVMKHKIVLEKITGWTILDKDATDDRLGAMMGTLGGKQEKISAFQKENGKHVIQAYELPTELARYDTTSFNVHHCPEKNGNGLFNFGFSKDKRPDLLQFKQGLGVLDPAGVPIFTETLAGNDADDPRYVPVWREMAETIGRTDFIYVADSKAGALETRAVIDREGGNYLFPLPMTGKVPEELKKLVSEPSSALEEIRLDKPVDDGKEPAVIGRGFEVEKTMEWEEGEDKHVWKERWLIVQSHAHAERKKKALTERLAKAEKTLGGLTPKKDEGPEQFQERAEKIVEKYSVKGCLQIEVKEDFEEKKRYLKRGRPSPDTPYEMVSVRRLHLDICRNQAVIDEQEDMCGWRVYVSNASSEKMSLQQSVRYYRDEWLVERGMHRFKRGSLPALPLFLRIPERIRGLMLLLTIALQVLTLMEFVVRRELAIQGETLGGLVPGNPKMKTARPTTERLLAQFKGLNLLIEEREGKVVGRLVEKLTPLQKHIIELLGLSQDIYELSFSHPPMRKVA
jgi:transposase